MIFGIGVLVVLVFWFLFFVGIMISAYKKEDADFGKICFFCFFMESLLTIGIFWAVERILQ